MATAANLAEDFWVDGGLEEIIVCAALGHWLARLRHDIVSVHPWMLPQLVYGRPAEASQSLFEHPVQQTCHSDKCAAIALHLSRNIFGRGRDSL